VSYKIVVRESHCKGVDGCGLCIHVCPKDVYDVAERLTDKGVHPPEPERIDDCSGCKLCMIYCPDMVITVERGDEDTD